MYPQTLTELAKLTDTGLDIRITNGKIWMYWDGVQKEWVIRESSRLVATAQAESDACQKFLLAGVNKP